MTVLILTSFEMEFNVAKLDVCVSAPFFKPQYSDLEFMSAKYYSQTSKKWKLYAILDILQ
jgi:hypothetical protein